jgi:hypothetical protein
MPIFYIDLVNGSGSWQDDEGYDLANVAEALDEARKSACDLMASDIREGKPLGLNRRFRIREEGGPEVGSMPFADAIPPEH